MTSNDPQRFLIGLFLFFLLVIGPTAAGIALLVVLRKMTIHSTIILNLIFALITLVVALLILTGGGRAGLPNHSPFDPVQDGWPFVVALCWVMSAVGLFFRKRIAWIVSLVFAGVSVCLFAVIFVTAVRALIFPDTEMNHIRQLSLDGYLFAVLFGLMLVSFVLAFSLRLFIGLMKTHKELCKC